MNILDIHLFFPHFSKHASISLSPLLPYYPLSLCPHIQNRNWKPHILTFSSPSIYISVLYSLYFLFLFTCAFSVFSTEFTIYVCRGSTLRSTVAHHSHINFPLWLLSPTSYSGTMLLTPLFLVLIFMWQQVNMIVVYFVSSYCPTAII